MRQLLSAIAILWALASQALAAGSVPIALAQQFDGNGNPLVGCQLYLYVVGTVATPQNAFQDTALSNALPWPVTCDANGRLPMFYLADGSVHVRLTNSSGVVQFDYPSMLVIGPSSGGGGGSTVDPTTIASTGDIKFRVTSEFVTGWVKLNAQTIGSAASGATQRANADTQNLFTYLWTNCTNAHCPVSGGRGASATADFSANKTIQLPDWRARIPVGLDDMGNTAAGRMLASNVTSGGGDGVTTPLATGGEANHTLLAAEIPSITSSGSASVSGSFPGNIPYSLSGTWAQSSASGAGNPFAQNNGAGVGNVSSLSSSGSASVTSSNTGGGTHNNMQPFALGTWYIKL